MSSLWVPGPLPGLNEIIDAAALRKPSGWNGYMDLKRRWGNTVATFARLTGFRQIESGHFTYVIQEPNRRRDPSNIVAGAIKIIEDGLQEAELLPNDGWKQVLSIRPYWLEIPGGAADHGCVSLFVTQEDPLTFEEAAYHHDINRRNAHARQVRRP